MDIPMSMQIAKQKRTGHTGSLWREITGISDLDATSIERIGIHGLAVDVVRPITCNRTIVIAYIVRVAYLFTIFSICHRRYNVFNVVVDGSVWADDTVGRQGTEAINRPMSDP